MNGWKCSRLESERKERLITPFLFSSSNTSLSNKEAKLADAAYETLYEYMKKYKGSNNTPLAQEPPEPAIVGDEADIDELDF